MNRFDLYAPIHKAIRSVLFSTTTAFARANFSDDAQAVRRWPACGTW